MERRRRLSSRNERDKNLLQKQFKIAPISSRILTLKWNYVYLDFGSIQNGHLEKKFSDLRVNM